MTPGGCIITNDNELELGMKVEIVKKDNRSDRKSAVVGNGNKIIAGSASMNLAGIEKIRCHCVVA